jgi:hypothetical protein
MRRRHGLVKLTSGVSAQLNDRAHAIENISVLLPEDSATTDAAYFYCSFDNLASQDVVNIVGSLLAQLSSKRPETIDALKRIHAEEKSSGSPDKPATIEQLIRAFLDGTRGRRTVIFIDAINEAGDESKLLDTVMALVEQSNDDVRVILSSTAHHARDGMKWSCRVREVQMRDENVDGDVDIFVKHTLANDEQLRRLGEDTKGEISRAINERSNGM